MTYDISHLKPDEKQILFKNLVISEFTMMQHELPAADDPFWEGRPPPNIMPRKSPFRTSSNANFLLHQKDEVKHQKKGTPNKPRTRKYSQKQVVNTRAQEVYAAEVREKQRKMKVKREAALRVAREEALE